jgi:hypothetical protein
MEPDFPDRLRPEQMHGVGQHHGAFGSRKPIAPANEKPIILSSPAKGVEIAFEDGLIPYIPADRKERS